MREFSFRAWDNVKNEMLYAYHFIDFEQKLFGFASGVHHHYINLMQYTGLKDKNGKEIYEGDKLIRCKDEIEGEVVFERGGYEVYVDGEQDHDLHFWCYCCGQCEVIGNIYENSDLLKKGQS